MNLSRKIILVIVTTFIALVCIVAVTSDIILLQSFADLETRVLKDNLSKVTNRIVETFSELDVSAKYFGEQFRHGGAGQISNREFKTFATNRIDFIACIGRKGEQVGSWAADSNEQRYVELTDDQSGVLQQATRHIIGQGGKRQWYGFLALGRNVAQFAIRPFDNGSVIVVGKYLNKEEVNRVFALTGFDIEVRPVDAGGMPEDFSRA